VAADQDGLRVPTGARPGLAWTNVPAGIDSGRRGNVNDAEVRAILAHLEDLLVAQGYYGSVGIVTPFRPQALALAEAVAERLPAERRAAADLRVGTVDSFQGQERDLILFSPVVHARAASSAVAFLQKDWRRLNVAISRARAVAHVFGDLAYARSGAVRRLQSLAAQATEPRRPAGEGVFDSVWERSLYDAMRGRGLDPCPQYEIAGRRLDFALFRGDVRLDVEVDGRRWHQDADGNRKLDDHWRDHQLRSLGWRVRRFWVDELHDDLEGCLDRIERDLA
jgi:very-short-patch-repair endonuclease